MPSLRTSKLGIPVLLLLGTLAVMLSETAPKTGEPSALLRLVSVSRFHEIPQAGRELAAAGASFRGMRAGYACTRIGFWQSDLFLWNCRFRGLRGRVQIELNESRRLDFEARYTLADAHRDAWTRFGAWGVLLSALLFGAFVRFIAKGVQRARLERAFQKRADEEQQARREMDRRTQSALREIVKHYWTPDPAHATSDPGPGR